MKRRHILDVDDSKGGFCQLRIRTRCANGAQDHVGRSELISRAHGVDRFLRRIQFSYVGILVENINTHAEYLNK